MKLNYKLTSYLLNIAFLAYIQPQVTIALTNPKNPVQVAQNSESRTWNIPNLNNIPFDPIVWQENLNDVTENQAFKESASLFCKLQNYNYATSWNVIKTPNTINQKGTLKFNRGDYQNPTYCPGCKWYFSSITCSQDNNNNSIEIVSTQAISKEINNIAKQITVRIDGAKKGTGVIVNKQGNKYTILTNYHVVQTKGKYTLRTPDGKTYSFNSTQVKKISNLDLAVLQFTSNDNYNYAKLGDSNQVTEGTLVYVAGWPVPNSLNTERGYRFSEGKIYEMVRKPIDGYTLIHNANTIPGMSGGPLLNDQGELIGINGLSATNINSGAVDFASIPINEYKKYQNINFGGNTDSSNYNNNITYNNNNFTKNTPPQHRNKYGLGLDLIWYCSYKHGSSARLVSRENNAYGWKCEVGGKDLDIDVYDVCQVIYGDSYQPKLADFNDPGAWYCDTNSSINSTNTPRTWTLEFSRYQQVGDRCWISNQETIKVIQSGSNLSGKIPWSTNGNPGYAIVTGKIASGKVSLRSDPPYRGFFAKIFQGTLNNQGYFSGKIIPQDVCKSGSIGLFKLIPER